MLNLIAALVVSASLMPPGKQMYTDSAGRPLSGGKVYTYAAGTSTPLATYSDQAGATPNANPVVLNSRGEASIFWGAGPYKVTLRTSADALIWTQDNLYPPYTAAEPLKLYSGGNAGAPELTWTDDLNSGLYLIGPDNVGLSIGGTKRWDYAAAGSTLTGTLTVSGATTLQSTLGVTGTATFNDAATFAGSTTTSGIARFAGGVSGAVTFNDAVTFLGSVAVPTPGATTDATTKAYVDAAVAANAADDAAHRPIAASYASAGTHSVTANTCLSDQDVPLVTSGVAAGMTCVPTQATSLPAGIFRQVVGVGSEQVTIRECNLTAGTVNSIPNSWSVTCFPP